MDQLQETMQQKKVRYEAAARAAGATKFEFIVMPDGDDYGCHVDFGNGMESFYLDEFMVRDMLTLRAMAKDFYNKVIGDLDVSIVSSDPKKKDEAIKAAALLRHALDRSPEYERAIRIPTPMDALRRSGA